MENEKLERLMHLYWQKDQGRWDDDLEKEYQELHHTITDELRALEIYKKTLNAMIRDFDLECFAIIDKIREESHPQIKKIWEEKQLRLIKDCRVLEDYRSKVLKQINNEC